MLDAHPNALHIPSARPGVLDIDHADDVKGFARGAEQQRQAEKAEAVGHLAGGLVHDFNNLLNVIVGNLDRAGRLLPRDTLAARCVTDAMMATDRAVALSRRLLAFVRQQPLLPKVVDVDELLLDLKPLIDVAASGCRVTLDLRCGWQSLVDANQLENAVLNLAVNARDTMPDGGRLSIATRTLESEVEGRGSRDYVLLEVRDTGLGMSPEVQEKASGLLFTTKAEGSGTGLGLSQVFGLAKECGGAVRIASDVGKGTTITLHLPRADPACTASLLEQPRTKGAVSDGSKAPEPNGRRVGR